VRGIANVPRKPGSSVEKSEEIFSRSGTMHEKRVAGRKPEAPDESGKAKTGVQWGEQGKRGDLVTSRGKKGWWAEHNWKDSR